jgi:FkbM family methyltransferase
MTDEKPTIFFATPTKTGNVSGPYQAAWTRTVVRLQRLGWGWMHVPEPSSQVIDIARNILAKKFLDSAATHLFFIDADLGWEDEAIERFVRFDVEMVGGHYCARLHDWTNVALFSGRGVPPQRLAASMTPSLATKTDGGKTTLVKHPTMPLIQADWAPGGFQCWKRSAIERLVEHYRETDTIRVGDPRWPDGLRLTTIFDFRRVRRETSPGVVELVRDGEDVTVCRRWRELGGEVWLDPAARFEHMGDCSHYSPSLAERMTDEATLRTFTRLELTGPGDCLREVGAIAAGAYAFAPLPSPPRVVLDIGASIGGFARWMIDRYGPELRVHCYEPHPRVIPHLERNAVPQMRLERAAVVGDGRPERVTLYDGKQGTIESTICEDVIDTQAGPGRFEVATIDAATLPAADVVKIDTEGAELEILARYLGTHPPPKVVVVEHHRPGDRRELIELAATHRLGLQRATSSDGQRFGTLVFAL